MLDKGVESPRFRQLRPILVFLELVTHGVVAAERARSVLVPALQEKSAGGFTDLHSLVVESRHALEGS